MSGRKNSDSCCVEGDCEGCSLVRCTRRKARRDVERSAGAREICTERPCAFPRVLIAASPSRSILLGLLPPPAFASPYRSPTPGKNTWPLVGRLTRNRRSSLGVACQGLCRDIQVKSEADLNVNDPTRRTRAGREVRGTSRLGPSLPANSLIGAVVYCVCSLASSSGSRVPAHGTRALFTGLAVNFDRHSTAYDHNTQVVGRRVLSLR